MSTAPALYVEEGEFPLVAQLAIAGIDCTAFLAEAVATSSATLHGQPVAVLAMRLGDGRPGHSLFQPLTRESGEAMIAGIRRALDEAGL